MSDSTVRKRIEELADAGVLVELGWRRFATAIPEIASVSQKEMMKDAFMIGAQHAYACAIMLANGDAPMELQQKRLDSIGEELKAYLDELEERLKRSLKDGS